jgi:hypothetical protein
MLQTFGLKNKNKSSKVKQQINTIKQQQATIGKNKESVSNIWHECWQRS